MMKSFLFLALAIFLFSCGSIRTAAPTAIGILPLHSYKAKSPVADTVYQVFADQNTFADAFEALHHDAKKPGFSGQTVVAISFSGDAQPNLQFGKAEIAGHIMNVYLVACTPGNAGCFSEPVVMAATPKSTSVKEVSFFISGQKKRTLPVY